MANNEIDERTQLYFKKSVTHEIGACDTFHYSIFYCLIIHPDLATLLRSILCGLLFEPFFVGNIVRRQFFCFVIRGTRFFALVHSQFWYGYGPDKAH